MNWSKLKSAFGIAALFLFVLIYGIELLPHHGRPATVRWIEEAMGRTGLIVINIGIAVAFLALLPYRRETKREWRSRGVFVAFVIALMTEMFGWPLLLFLLSPLVEIPVIAPEYFQTLGHWPASVGTALSLLGLALVVAGWRQIHRAEGLVTSGVYRLMRHPQYTGLLLFTFGWILHWPSVLTLVLWPLLVAAYVWLAKREEAMAVEEFGAAYLDYAAKTKRFIPLLV
jgi:protein-S-isoprenylcysteine O-methyltransferase Ste14